MLAEPEAERQQNIQAARQQLEQQQSAQQAPSSQDPTAPGQSAQGGAPTSAPPTPGGNAPAPSIHIGGSSPAGVQTREAAISSSPRIQIDTPRVHGSIALRGARIDDIVLKNYRETVDEDSPEIELFSPSGSANPYYAEYGWVGDVGANVKLPHADTVWLARNQSALTPDHPVVLTYDNGEGLVFERTYAIDDNYMVKVTQSVANNTSAAVTLYPYALVSRHGTPSILGFFILHEGLIGVFGEQGLEEVDYDDIAEEKISTFSDKSGWIGITDKYWASVLIPDQNTPYTARMTASEKGPMTIYQTDYLLDGKTIAAGSIGVVTGRLFAGAKESQVIDGYQENEGVFNFELLIDWGWFYFITKPLYQLINILYLWAGNFGVAILLVTVLVKLIFFPLANKSYVSMSRMKKVQPEMTVIRERFANDKAAQQKAMMELYKKEKINPMSGCWPMLLQIPVFFSLYKVLFVTIEMRHAPFFGWVQDLAAPDPTNFFNLLGLIPWDPPSFLALGVWPLIMGVTMFLQMRLNPPPPDPVQAQLFNWMPVLFTFLLASFPVGLVIYWAWNNTLTILQQSMIMRRQGVEIDMLGNIKSMFVKKPDAKEPK